MPRCRRPLLSGMLTPLQNGAPKPTSLGPGRYGKALINYVNGFLDEPG